MTKWLLFLIVTQGAIASRFSTRYTAPSEKFCYTFEEGQFDYTRNTSISGPVFQEFGNMTLFDRRCVDWNNNANESSAGLLRVTDCPFSIEDEQLRSEFTLAQTATTFNDLLANPSNFSVEFWYRFTAETAVLDTFWDILELSNYPIRTHEVFRTFLDTSSPEDVEIAWQVPLCCAVLESFQISPIPFGTIHTTVVKYSYDNHTVFFSVNATSYPSGSSISYLNFQGNADQGSYALDGPAALAGFGGLTGFFNPGYSFVLLMAAFYTEALNSSVITQNFLAGPPPSIPYSRTYNTTAVSTVPATIHFSQICKTVNFFASLTVEISSNVHAGTLYNLGVPLTSFPVLLVNDDVVYVSNEFVFGVAADDFTYRCFDSSVNLYGVLDPMSITVIFQPAALPNITIYQSLEANYLTVTLQGNAEDPPSLLVPVVVSLPQTGSSLFQYNGGCPGSLITTVPTTVTDSEHRVCVYPFPSSVYPTNQPLPPDTLSGDFYVGNVTLTYLMNSTTGQISPNNATILVESINHLFPTNYEAQGFEDAIIPLHFDGTDYSPGSSQIFNVIFTTSPLFGTVRTVGDNQSVVLNTPYYLGNFSFYYVLRTINPGVVSFLWRLQENSVREWESFQANTTITNLNTPHQPFMTFPIIPPDGYVAYTFNAVNFNSTIIVPDQSNWPASRVLHLTIKGTIGIVLVFCLPQNTTFLIFQHVSYAGDFNPIINLDQGAGCSDATLEISAPLDMLNELTQHIAIVGETVPITSSFTISACLYDTSLVIVTCDPVNDPHINSYTIPVNIFSKGAPDFASSTTVLDWFSWTQLAVLLIAILMCYLCICFVPFRVVWMCCYNFCNVICCCNRCWCNRCVNVTYANRAQLRELLSRLEADNKRLKEEVEVLESRLQGRRLSSTRTLG